MHLGGMLIEIGECVLKTHEEMGLFKDTGAHKAADQLLISGGLSRHAGAVLPALGAVGAQVRCMDEVPPAGDIGADLVIGRDVGRGTGRVRGEENCGAPAILADAAAYPVAAQIAVDGIVEHQMQRLILLELALRFSIGFQKFQENLFRCHAWIPSFMRMQEE